MVYDETVVVKKMIEQSEVLLGFPVYGGWCSLSTERYAEVVSGAQACRDKALKLYAAYWSSRNELQYEMAAESLEQLRTWMLEIMESADISMTDALSKRATFLIDLAAAINGLR